MYATELTAGFIEDKLRDHKMPVNSVKTFHPDKDILKLGAFKISSFRVSHSVPDTVGLCIDTPEGKMFHVADYKFDWTPVDGRPFDVSKAAILASDGVLGLASDCLGSTPPAIRQVKQRSKTKLKRLSGQQQDRSISPPYLQTFLGCSKPSGWRKNCIVKLLLSADQSKRKQILQKHWDYLNILRG